MSSPLLTTKLYIPPVRPELVSRPRLIERLNAGLHRKLTLISAPAGFGKTTLLSEWIHHSRDKSRTCPLAAWVSLDEADNDPARFWAYLIAALQTMQAGVAETALAMLQSPQPSPIESVLTTLINEVNEELAASVLVLDDYHVIEAHPIHDALAFLLDHMPQNMHLVIATRADPALPLARLRAHGQLTELRGPDLRFTPDEAVAFLNQVMGLGLSERDVAVLETRTEGWIAGLQLAALSIQGRDDVAGFIEAFSGSHRYVIDYLAEEVLQRQSDGVRDFLCQTAILDRLTAPLCNAVTGRDDSQTILAQLERANLFLIPLDDKREWYRYHRLFADFLRTQYDVRSLVSFHRKATHWYEANGFVAEAVKHALAAGDVHEARGMIELAAEDAFKNGEVTTLLGWLNALPDELVRARHELAIYKGWALFLMGQVEAVESYLESAEKSLPSDVTPVSRSRLIGLRACLTLARDAPPNAIELLMEALDLIGDTDPVSRSAILLALGKEQRMLGDTAAAAQSYREAYGLRQKIGAHLATVIALGDLTILLWSQGQRREAAALCRQALDQCVDARGKPIPVASIAHIVLGVLCYDANELARACQHLLKGLELSKQLSLFAPKGRMFLARLQHALGEHEAALETIQEARRMTSKNVYQAELAAVETDFRLKQGDIAAAVRWAKEANLSPTDPPHPVCVEECFTYTRLLLAQNRPTDARTLLASSERSAREEGHYRNLITIHVLQALTQQALGHREEALTHLEQALRLAAPDGYLRAFLEEDQSIIKLLPEVRQTAPDFVDQLLASAELSQQAVAIPPQPLIEPLTPRELEVLRLIAAGLRNQEIADQLFISVATVKRHISNIYGKLGVSHRTQAVAHARELGLV